MESLTFHRPVHPGETVTATSKVVDLRESQSRPRDGIVTWHTMGHNTKGELVVEFHRTNLVAKRGNGR